MTPPPVPALVSGSVNHVRHRPLRHAFTHRHLQWLVDVDALPRYPWPIGLLTRFDARDHLDGGRHGGGIRGDVERFLAQRGIVLESTDTVLMLAHARVLGHVFDPLTVFWCLTADNDLRAVVFEVHNTYGGRHAYLLDVDAEGRASTDKVFYVSPFNDVEGTYAVRLHLSPARVSVSVALDRAGARLFSARSSGVPCVATTRSVIVTNLRHAFMTQRVSALIRLHGIRLWLRGLPIVSRPHSIQGVVQ